ncbi:MAG: hypothetical protein QOG53_3617 [Frankiales bacterium]|jgi:hypothetical protein|nr:hypothetical protein [Frankiales bacterium]
MSDWLDHRRGRVGLAASVFGAGIGIFASGNRLLGTPLIVMGAIGTPVAIGSYVRHARRDETDESNVLFGVPAPNATNTEDPPSHVRRID